MTIEHTDKKFASDKKKSRLERIWNKLARWTSRRLPQGLYGRALIIIIAPMVLLQSVLVFVFMERHWQTVTERLSRAVTADIAAVIEIVENFPHDKEFSKITTIASEKLDLNVAILEPSPFPPAVGKPFFSLLDDTLRTEITSRIARPFWIDTVGNSNLLEIRILLENPKDHVLRIFVRRNQAYASNSHIFLVWMVGTSIVLLLIAILFLRNQIRPIQQLSQAADSFGKGQKLPENFKIRGAQEVRQAGLAFLQMRDRINKQIEQRTAMLTGVSHDLRTVLTRFKLQLALVPQTTEVEELQADVDDMHQMLQGYLDFARGGADEKPQFVNVFGLIDRHRVEAEIRRKQFSIDCDPDLTFKTHQDAITRLIGNLVGNAFRYADQLEVTVKSSKKRLTIIFDDDGPGIPEDKRAEVFKPFYRLDEARNLDESGTGLGLSIARDIARNHGGDINLYDSQLGGLRAIVTLPR